MNDMLFSKLLSDTEIKYREERSTNEVDFVIEDQNDVKMMKVINVNGIKEKKVLIFSENNLLLSDCCLNFIYPFEIYLLNNCSEYIIISREYYLIDLREIIHNKSLSHSDICSLICLLCDVLLILLEYDIVIEDLKISNVIYDENENVKLCDLFLDLLRKDEDMRIYDIYFKTPEELSGLECNERSVIWSIGCILYEMILKKLPFNEDNNMIKTKENIVKCKYSLDVKCDNDLMKEMIFRMLKMKSEDRLSLKELKKEMMKMSEILRDGDNNIMICKERKEILFNNDYLIEIPPFNIQTEYYIQSYKYDEIRDELIKSYNNKSNEIILSILLMMKLYKMDYSIEEKLRFQVYHQCKEGVECYLDRMIVYITVDRSNKEIIKINSEYICFCEEGMLFLFKILKLINPNTLYFDVSISIQNQSLFGLLLYQLQNLQKLNISGCNLTFYFIESFIRLVEYMKCKYIHLFQNPIGPKGFKLLLPYLYLLINKDNELNIKGMNLNDESMILLSEELYKYPNLKRIDIRYNNIHSRGLKALFSKFPISNIRFNFNRCNKDILIDKDIPELVKYIKVDSIYYYKINLNELQIDHHFIKSFISLRSNELIRIIKLNLSNNKLTYKGIRILVRNFSSLPNLKDIRLDGNEIGDEGMKLLSPHLHLLICETNCYCNNVYCSKMGLSSIGLKYLVNGLKSVNLGEYEQMNLLDISDNHIDSDGIGYLMNYIKENNCIKRLIIHDNPIGNTGFKVLLNKLNMLVFKEEMNLSNTSIDDESVILLVNIEERINNCFGINLNGNNIQIDGLNSFCSKSLNDWSYPFIIINNPLWNTEALECYLNYCIQKERKRKYYFDFSNLKINDSHIELIKQIVFTTLNISNNNISYEGLKELVDYLSYKRYTYISIFNNCIGDEGIEIICSYLDVFVYHKSSLNLSNIGMSGKGLKMLIERLKDYRPLEKIDISRNVLNESELILMKENKEIFDSLDELSITVYENIMKSELKSFLETFSTIGTIKINGIKVEGKVDVINQSHCCLF